MSFSPHPYKRQCLQHCDLTKQINRQLLMCSEKSHPMTYPPALPLFHTAYRVARTRLIGGQKPTNTEDAYIGAPCISSQNDRRGTFRSASTSRCQELIPRFRTASAKSRKLIPGPPQTIRCRIDMGYLPIALNRAFTDARNRRW